MNYFPYTGLDFLRAMFNCSYSWPFRQFLTWSPRDFWLFLSINTKLQPSSKTFPMQGFFSTLDRLTELQEWLLQDVISSSPYLQLRKKEKYLTSNRLEEQVMEFLLQKSGHNNIFWMFFKQSYVVYNECLKILLTAAHLEVANVPEK